MTAPKPERRKSARRNDPLRRGRRADPRAEITLPATLDALSGQRRTSLLDVSALGACLEGTDLPPVGREVIVRCENIDSFATVAWSAGSRCGVTFEEPLRPGTLIALRRVANETRSQFKSADELQAVADWINGLAR